MTLTKDQQEEIRKAWNKSIKQNKECSAYKHTKKEWGIILNKEINGILETMTFKFINGYAMGKGWVK